MAKQRFRRRPVQAPSQTKISVQDVYDYSTPEGAAQANEEMRRLALRINAVETKEPTPVVTQQPVAEAVKEKPQPPVIAPEIDITSSDGSIDITEQDSNFDLRAYNYSESAFYDHIATGPTDQILETNASFYEYGFIPFICDTPRIKKGLTNIHHLENQRYNYIPNTPRTRDYMFFYPKRAGVYQITVELFLKIDRASEEKVDSWITGLLLILAKCPYAVLVNEDFIWGPILRQNISTELYGATDAIEHIIAFEKKKNSRMAFAFPGPDPSDTGAIAASFSAIDTIMVRGTTLVYMGASDVLTVWYKMKTGFFEEGATYEWDDTETSQWVVATHEGFEANWQGNNYKEINWFSPTGDSLIEIVKLF